MVGRENLAAYNADTIDRQREKVAGVVAGVVAEMNGREVDKDRTIESQKWLEEAFLSNVVTVSGGERKSQEVVVNRDGDKKVVKGVAIGEQFVYDVRTLREAERIIGGERGYLMGRVREEYEVGVRQGVERVVDAQRAREILSLPDEQKNREIFRLFGGRAMRGMGGVVMRVLEEKAGEGAGDEPLGGDMRAVVEELRALRREMAGRAGGGEVEPRSRQGLDNDAQLRYFQEELQLKEALTVVSKEEWLEGLRTKSYDKPTIPAIWMYKPPEWMAKGTTLKEWRDFYTMTEALSYAVAQRRINSEFGTKVDMVKNSILGMAPVKESILKWLYNDSDYGFKEALEALVNDLFVRDQDGLFVFKPYRENDRSAVDRFIANSPQYKLDLAKSLARSWARSKGGANEELRLSQAVMMISLASDFLEIGGQYELADSGRKVDYVSDALRTVMRPSQKFGSKIGGGELWGGPLGEWAMIVSGNVPRDAKALLENLGLAPQVLCGSILNTEVTTIGNENMPLGEALMGRKTVGFKNVAKDFYFSWKKDQVMAACDLWMFISGKIPLEFRKFDENDNLISKWRSDLYNAVSTLRDVARRGGVPKITMRVVAAAVAGSVGIWPFEPVYLRIGKSDESIDSPSFKDDYVDVCGNIVRSLLLPVDERDRLKEFLGITRNGANDLFRKAVDYDYVVNETIPRWMRLPVQKKREWKLI